jgi:hypothetical protein
MNILDVLGGLAPQGQQASLARTGIANLAPTPAQKTFDPDKQALIELLLGNGVGLAEAKQIAAESGISDPTALFNPSTALSNPSNVVANQPAAPQVAPVPNNLVEKDFPDPRIQLPNQTGKPSFLAELFNFPGSTKTETNAFGRENVPENLYPNTPSMTQFLGAKAKEVFEGVPYQESIDRIKNQFEADKQQQAQAQTAQVMDIFRPRTETPPAGQPPLAEQGQSNQQMVEKVIGAKLDDITSGKLIAPKVDITEPLSIDGKEVATPEDINAALSGEKPEVAAKVKDSIFNQDGMSELLLGVGISLLQGRPIGDALAIGFSQYQKAKSAREAKKRQAMLDEVNIGVKQATAAEKTANAVKTNLEVQKILTGYSSPKEVQTAFQRAYQTNIGEQGFGDELSTVKAQAIAAKQVLASHPTDTGMKQLLNDSLVVLLRPVDEMSQEEAAKEIAKLRDTYGADAVNQAINQIVSSR